MKLKTETNEVINCKTFDEFKRVIIFLKATISLEFHINYLEDIFNTQPICKMCINLNKSNTYVGVDNLDYYIDKNYKVITVDEFFKRNNVNERNNN